MIIKATPDGKRWNLETDEGEDLGSVLQYADIEPTALAWGAPGDTLEIHAPNGQIEEIDL